MNKKFRIHEVVCALSAALILLGVGCNQEDVAKEIKKAEESAGKVAESVSEEAGEMVKKGEEMASKLGAEAMSFLKPMTEKFGKLEDLKKTPEELKGAVNELIESD